MLKTYIRKPAALLAKPLADTGDDDYRSLSMELTDLMPAVILFGFSQVGCAVVSLAVNHS